MNSSPRKRWTLSEKWLFIAPVLVGVFALGATLGPDWVRTKRGLPRELAMSANAHTSAIALSRDGKILAACEQWGDSSRANANLIYLWDAQSLKPLAPLSRPIVRMRGHWDDQTRSINLSPPGDLAIYVTGQDIQAFDRRKQALRWHHPGTYEEVNLSPNGKYVAFHDGSYRVLDADTGQSVSSWKTFPAQGGTATAFSEDGRWLASVGGGPKWSIWSKDPNNTGGKIELRSTATWKTVRTFSLLNAKHIALSPDGSLIVGVAPLFVQPFNGGYAGSLARCFDMRNGRLIWEVDTREAKAKAIYGWFNAMCFSADNSLVALQGATANHNFCVFLLDAKTGQLRRTLATPGGRNSFSSFTHGLVFSPDGKRLFGRDQSAVFVWDLG